MYLRLLITLFPMMVSLYYRSDLSGLLPGSKWVTSSARRACPRSPRRPPASARLHSIYLIL